MPGFVEKVNVLEQNLGNDLLITRAPGVSGVPVAVSWDGPVHSPGARKAEMRCDKRPAGGLQMGGRLVALFSGTGGPSSVVGCEDAGRARCSS